MEKEINKGNEKEAEVMTNKIQNAVLDMMQKVKFSENEHTYQDTATGEWLQGVSSISSIVPKDWLSAWGAKECAKFLGYSDFSEDTELAEKMFAKIKGCSSVAEYIAILKEAKGASGRKSKTALVDGKAGHKWIQVYILAKIRTTELPEIPQGTLERPVRQFLDWETENIKQWVLSEARVAYPEKKYAGSLDAMAILINSRLAVIDFKFASHISEDFYLQTAGYAACFEPYGIQVDDRIIVRLPKTLELQEWDKETHTYKMIKNNIEVKRVETAYEMDRDIFFHCVAIKKWINLFTKKR